MKPWIILEAFRNIDLAEWCVRNARKAYPDGAITVFVDGDDGPEYQRLAPHAEVIYGERLWGVGNAGPLWKRRIERFLMEPADFLFKVDTDTGFYRAISELPAHRCLFGTVIPGGRGFVQGGFIGMNRAVAGEILASGALEEAAMKIHNVRDYEAGSEISADDRAISGAADKLGIPLFNHPEVASRWKIRADNSDLRFAVVHPCKNGKL